MRIQFEHIVALRNAAQLAGNILQVAICDRALGEERELPLTMTERAKLVTFWPTREAARAQCERVIRDAAH